jgi:hypothetical protein
MKIPAYIKGVLAIGVALTLTCCGPLGGVDPLDSGELSTAAMQVAPSSAERQEERRLQDERVQRLSGERDYGSTTKGSAGIDLSSEF